MDDTLNDEQDFEELYGKWEPKLYQASMGHTDRHFAALLGGPRWDDPYTIILIRDAVEQTFSRSDVRRELRDIRVIPSLKDDAGPSYVTISLQGDIYVVGPDGSQHFIIPGTQAESETASEVDFRSILPYDNRWLVAGSGNFLKLGKGESWEDVSPSLTTEYPYSETEWAILGENIKGEIFIVAIQRPSQRYFNLYPGHPLYRSDMAEDERFKLKKRLRAEKGTHPVLTTLYTGTPGSWKRQELPERIARTSPPYASLAAVASDNRGNDYLVGSDGLVMIGTPESGFSEISSLPDREKHYSDAAYLDDELVLIADSELFRFDGHLAKTFTPKVKLQLGSKRVQPSAIFAREGRLHVFDYGNRIFSLVEGEWREYAIPNELLQRPFKARKP
ncbi:hypothetical protein [Agrobacterium radiobacter]|uniref:hypothetical protein n=1 Tax=Agrobacterium radiobacter TaxID=362 RepID=UPI003F8334ED